MIEIPSILADSGCQFIRVRRGEKTAIDPGWENGNCFPAGHSSIIRHLKAGGNYGVKTGPGIVIIDCDDPALVPCLEPFRETFIVRSSTPDRGHYYLQCPDAPIGEKITLYDPETGNQIGDIRTPESPFYVVGPGSIHPSGAVYTANDLPIKEVTWGEIEEATGRFMEKPEGSSATPKARTRGKGVTGRKAGGIIPDGERNGALTSIAGGLRAKGADTDEISANLHRVNLERCNPPLEFDEVELIVKSVSSYPAGTPLTDMGNAARFIDLFGNDVRYSREEKTWYVWNGKVWEPDRTERVMKMADRVARGIYVEARNAEDPDERKRIAKWAVRTEALKTRVAMIDSARYHVPATRDMWDADRNLFNIQNGTVELDTLTFREHRRGDMLTKIGGVRYDPAARCPVWEEHLRVVFDGNMSLIEGFQMALGYSLLPGNPLQVVFILHGSGENGKSKTVEAVQHIFGDYHQNAAPATFMVKKYPGSSTEDLARLHNTRFVTSHEPEDGAKLAESLIKQLTGGDTITARFLYQGSFDFTPELTIWIVTNHRPQISGTDHAIWRRIWLWPFDVRIPPEIRDPYIGDKLRAEGSGILNWMLDGLRKFHENGDRLTPPDEVARATAAYRSEQDVFGEFIDDCCVLIPGDHMTTVERRVLYEEYRHWCEDNGEPVRSARWFANKLRERGVRQGPKSMGVRSWVGIRLKRPGEEGNRNLTA